MTLELLAQDAAKLAAMRIELYTCGYRDIAEYKGLRVGTRIRHMGHQWANAYTEGTGYVVALTEKPNSGWARIYRAPDIELIALWDKPSPFGDSSRLSQLAQYHVEVIEVRA